MRNRQFFAALLFALTLHAALASAQQLTVQAAGDKQTVLTRADVEALPRVTVTTAVSGVATTFEGISLRAVLEKAVVGYAEALTRKTDGLLLIGGSGGWLSRCVCPTRTGSGVHRQAGHTGFCGGWQAAELNVLDLTAQLVSYSDGLSS
jgi:hypothetical protein